MTLRSGLVVAVVLSWIVFSSAIAGQVSPPEVTLYVATKEVSISPVSSGWAVYGILTRNASSNGIVVQPLNQKPIQLTGENSNFFPGLPMSVVRNGSLMGFKYPLTFQPGFFYLIKRVPTQLDGDEFQDSSRPSEPKTGVKRSWQPPVPEPAACRLLATPNDDIIGNILLDIDEVTPSGYLGIESPYLSNHLVIQKVKEALQRGVRIKIFTDPAKSALLREKFHGFEDSLTIHYRTDLHTKRIVIFKQRPIGSDDQALVYVGSLNLSENGSHNHEIMVRCTDRRVSIESFGDQMRDLKSRSVPPVEPGSRRILRSGDPQAREARRLVVQTFNSCKHPHDYLYVASFTIDDQETVDTLINAKKTSSKPIKVLLDGENWRRPRGALKELVDAGIDVYLFNKDGSEKTPLGFSKLAHLKAIIRTCNQTSSSLISTANLTVRGTEDLNYDLWEPGSFTFSYQLKRILDDLIHQSEKLESYMFEDLLPIEGSPEEKGQRLLEELREFSIQPKKDGYKARILRIIQAGAKLDLKDEEYGYTALMNASGMGDSEIVQALIAAGADVNQRTDEFDSALLLAAKGGHILIVQDLLTAHAQIDVGDRYGNTPLFFAVSQDNIALAGILLDAGANPDIPGDYRETGFRLQYKGGIPPLIWAINNKKIQMIQLLLAYGARPTEKDRYGKDAFDAAKDKPQILELLGKGSL